MGGDLFYHPVKLKQSNTQYGTKNHEERNSPPEDAKQDDGDIYNTRPCPC